MSAAAFEERLAASLEQDDNLRRFTRQLMEVLHKEVAAPTASPVNASSAACDNAAVATAAANVQGWAADSSLGWADAREVLQTLRDLLKARGSWAQQLVAALQNYAQMRAVRQSATPTEPPAMSTVLGVVAIPLASFLATGFIRSNVELNLRGGVWIEAGGTVRVEAFEVKTSVNAIGDGIQQAAENAAFLGWACEAAGLVPAGWSTQLHAKVLLLAGVRRGRQMQRLRPQKVVNGRVVVSVVFV